MNVIKVWAFLKKNFICQHFKVHQTKGIFIVEYAIKVSPTLLGRSFIYSCGCHYDKEIALAKALCEMVERIVILSPYVGPIEFYENLPYVECISGEVVPIEYVSPYFSKEKFFSSRGHACNYDCKQARLAARNEFFENLILEKINNGVLRLNKCDEIDISSILNELKTKVGDLSKFKITIINIKDGFFSLFWHEKYQGTVLGSAYNISLPSVIEKAALEAISLFDALSASEQESSQEWNISRFENLSDGVYKTDEVLKDPYIIERHSQLLFDLSLCMYQAIGESI